MSPSGDSAKASNSILALTGSLRSSHTPLLRAPRPQSLPAWIFQTGLSTCQSAPISARSNASSKGEEIKGRLTGAVLTREGGWAIAVGFCVGAALAVDGPSGTQDTSASP